MFETTGHSTTTSSSRTSMSSGEEYLAFSESQPAQYAPLVAVAKMDGSLSMREVTRNDISRISDTATQPGLWLFRKSMQSADTWAKRFAVIRGSFIFLFHSPQSDKPLALVPLDDVTVALPTNEDKTFDESRYYRANVNFELEVRHRQRPTTRLAVSSALERQELAVVLRARATYHLTELTSSVHLHKRMSQTANVHLTNTKLIGLAPLPDSGQQSTNTPNNSGTVTASAQQGLLSTISSSPLPPVAVDSFSDLLSPPPPPPLEDSLPAESRQEQEERLQHKQLEDEARAKYVLFSLSL
jgi:hypothetical protein